MRISKLVVLLLICANMLRAQAPPVHDPKIEGKWLPVQTWPFVAIHAALLPNGNIVGWSRKDGVIELDTWYGDPKTAKFTKVLNQFVQPFCAGQTFLPDGRLLVAGGHDRWDGDGAIQTTIFDYRTNKWSKSADMNAGRWYPTTAPLANGDVVVVSGQMPPRKIAEGSNRVNGYPQVWSDGHWRTLDGAYDPNIELYPFLFLAPNGHIFKPGPAPLSRWLDTAGKGVWSNGPLTKSESFRDYGSAVQYEPGRVLIVGGANPPIASAETIDLNDKNPAWREVGSMHFPRRQLNATILADGTVLVTGGTSGDGFNNTTTPVKMAELWNPAHPDDWIPMASASVIRVYHSISLLLPDASVLNAGGGLPPWGEPPPDPRYEAGPFHANAQIFLPPYLFKGTRPTITSAPEKVGYGEQFTVVTDDAAVDRVTWIRPGAVTHAFDESQSFAQLTIISKSGGKLLVAAPSRDTNTPPGPYMLFILHDGVPSVAKFVFLQK